MKRMKRARSYTHTLQSSGLREPGLSKRERFLHLSKRQAVVAAHVCKNASMVTVDQKALELMLEGDSLCICRILAGYDGAI